MNDDDGLLPDASMVDPVVEILLTNGSTIIAKQLDALAVVKDLAERGYCKMRTSNFDHVTVFMHGVAAVRGRPLTAEEQW
jgi:hypothetical protein